jgi:uncharacterized protein YjiK
MTRGVTFRRRGCVLASSISLLFTTAVVIFPDAASAAPGSFTATLVRTINTATLGSPSPDPAGITYIPSSDRLLVVDSEVEEMSLYSGANVFEITRTGTLVSVGDTTRFTVEPTGVGFDAVSATPRIFVSDDDRDEIYEVSAGTDARYGTADDVVTSFDTRETGNTDAEGVDVDSVTGHVLVMDGVGTEVYDYGAGANGRFDGVPPRGDDTVSHFDVGAAGARDPEGIEHDPVRDTILVLDHKSKRVYEYSKSGSLLNTIDIASANPVNAAGLTMAPASNGSGATNLYLVDRGVDNDSNPSENDGKIYEMSVGLPPAGNLPPTADAGSDQSVVLPASVTLTGSATDDGLPDPPGTVTTTWSKASGPGTVTFGDSGAASTTASFSTPGTYVLRLTVNDSALTDSDDVTVQVVGEGAPTTVEFPVATSSDDAEERPTGGVSLASSDLELVTDGTTQQTVGLRFSDVTIPHGAAILRSYVQFQADEVSTDAAALKVQGQAADNAATFQAVTANVSGRTRTVQEVAWTPEPWPTVSARGAAQQTPDISSVVQEITDRPGWSAGNAVAIIVTGTGRRTAEAFEGTRAPVLHVEYQVGGSVPNRPPVANAGPDQTIELPDAATLTGSVTDDGLPAGATVTSTWSLVNGPGPVSFADPTAASTIASFTTAGTYVLRLSANDSELVDTEDVTIQVLPVGTPRTLDLPISLSSDDAEERVSNGNVSLNGNDLELGVDKLNAQTVGLRFTGVTIPAGATIESAYVQFDVDEVSTAATALTIWGQAASNAATFQAVGRNVSSRPRTAANVLWSPNAWPTVHATGGDQRTPDLASVIREITSTAGWSSGNSIALIVTGTGRRTAESFDSSRPPVLHIQYHR